MGANANVGTTNLNTSEKWLLFDVNDGGTKRTVYVSAIDITMIHQDAADNKITYIFYKSGTGTSAIQIDHPADANKLLVDDIYKALFTLPTTAKQLIEQVISTIVPIGIKTGCDICPTKVRSTTVTSGALPLGIPTILLSIDGTQAYSLPDGDSRGDTITIIVSSATNTPVGTLTPATTAGAWATGGFNEVGQSLTLVWTATGWAISGRESGAAAGRAAVAGLVEIV